VVGVDESKAEVKTKVKFKNRVYKTKKGLSQKSNKSSLFAKLMS